MKPSTLLLAATLAANAVLLAVHFQHPRDEPKPAARSVGKAQASGTGNPSAAPAAKPGAPKSNQAAGAAKPAATADLRDFVAQLRAAGFPAPVIRAMLNARLEELFADRRATVYGTKAEIPPFWASDGSAATFLSDPERRAAYNALIKDRADLMKELLGTDAMPVLDSAESRAALKQQYGDLPIEKLIQAQIITRDYALKLQEARNELMQTDGVILPGERSKLAEVQVEKRAAMAALLTPDELFEYDLRSSPTANQLRSQLLAFNPSEEEFRAAYRVQQAFDAQYGMNAPAQGSVLTVDQMRERQAHLPEIQTQLAAVLGPERFADYQVATSPGSQQVGRLVARLELPASTVGEVLTVQKDTQAQATALRTDRTLTPAIRNQALAALADQAASQLTSKLGTKGLDAYRQNGGAWLQNLVPVQIAPRGGPAAPAP